MDNGEDGDSIEEICIERKTVFGREKDPQEIGLIKGIIINIRGGENIRESKHVLISMLESLLARMDIKEKKRVLTEKYGMQMTAEMEGRMQIMCNLSENIIEQGIEQGIERGIERGIEQGMDQKLTELIQIKLKKGKSVEQIAEDLEETVEHIEELIEKMEK